MNQYADIFKIRHNDVRPQKGRILISEPFMQDLYFQRSVILLVEHNAHNSMGFVLNKRTNLTVNSFFPELSHLPEIPVYLGGPVGANHLFFVHILGRRIPNGIQLDKNLYFDGDFEAVKRYLLEGNPVEGAIKFFLGYAGWTENQLYTEILNNSWLVSSSVAKAILLANNDAFWKESVEALGSPYATWTNYPKFPEMN